VLLHYIIYTNADHEVIKASSPLFCHIIMVGGDVAAVMCGVSAISNDLQCRLVPALTAVAFNSIFGALLAKTWVCGRACVRVLIATQIMRVLSFCASFVLSEFTRFSILQS
jgi:hypothetical protein